MMSSLPKLSIGGLHELVGRVALGQVAREDGGLAADLRRRLLGDVAVEVVDDDLGAVLDEQLGGRAADAARRAGDDRHLVVEDSHLFLVSCSRFLRAPTVGATQASSRRRGSVAESGESDDDTSPRALGLREPWPLPSASRRRQQPDETRSLILDTAERLLRERPFRELSVDEVMRPTGYRRDRLSTASSFTGLPDLG